MTVNVSDFKNVMDVVLWSYKYIELNDLSCKISLCNLIDERPTINIY